jgi:3-keto-disaccharide hydrolase
MATARLLVTSSALLAMSLALGARQTPPGQPQQQPASPEQKPERIELVTPSMPQLPNNGLGETDQALIAGQPWRIRDLNRPKPVTVAPGRHPGDPPSDAIVLFDGKDLSQWTAGGRGAAGAPTPPLQAPGWKVENGYMEVTPGAGSLTSKERFKDFQLHVEFATPSIPLGISQYRGNSGITIGGREIQILDNYNNQTYADGYVTAIYNQWPPLANPSLPPGQWQTIDIAYMAARYEDDRLVRNPFITVFLNGVMVHNNREIQPATRGGGAGRAGVATPATPPAAGGAAPAGAAVPARGPAIPPGQDQPIGLMGHPSAIPGNAIRYRNIWARRVQVELPTATPATAPAGRGDVR